MKLPIVSTDVGDLRRFLEDPNKPSGAVVEVGNSRALAAEVLRLLRDEKLRDEFGDNARKTAKAQLDLEVCVRKQAQIYKKILGRPS